MKKILLIASFLVSCILQAQDTKGLSPIPTNTTAKVGNTYAVVVGVSDYQHKDIPDLKYAHKDAEAFSLWLQSDAGGNLTGENITLLTNEKATNAKFAAALDGLIENCKEGDVAVIYFSGHGDVETKTVNQNGFLLLYDTPPTTYKAGAYSLLYLQDVISTLSINNKAKVLVVTDACHSGKLAGSSVNGSQLTNMQLTKQFANEVKIMSCQPNEFSLEGTQWGDGRGIFSYHLIEGMTGLADNNKDSKISLLEIGRYLEDKVGTEASPHTQIPMTLGDRQFTLAQVNPTALTNLISKKSKDSGIFGTTAQKGIGDELAGIDSLTQKLYANFKNALEKGTLLEPKGSSAYDLYMVLREKEELKSVHGLMRRNLAAALQDEVQQALNALLGSDPTETNQWRYNPAKYKEYPEYLAKAISLIGEKHYMYNALKAKQLYFEGYNIFNKESAPEQDPNKREAAKQRAKAKYLEAIAFEPQAAYIYQGIAATYFYNNPLQSDSLVKYCDKAIEFSPTWAVPYLDVAAESQQVNEISKAERYLTTIAKYTPSNYIVLERLSWLKQWQMKPDESISISDTMIKLRPELFNAYATKGTTLYLLKGDYINAEKEYHKSITLFDNWVNWSKYYLGSLYFYTGRKALGIKYYNKLLQDTTVASELKNWASLYILDGLYNHKDYEEMEKVIQHFEKTKQLGITQDKIILVMKGRIARNKHQLDKADSLFQASLVIKDPLASSDIAAYTELGSLAFLKGETKNANLYFDKVKSLFVLDNWEVTNNARVGLPSISFYLSNNEQDKVDFWLNILETFRPNDWQTPFAHALIACKNNQPKTAIKFLEKSVQQYLPSTEYIAEQALFQDLKKYRKFRKLMKKGIRNEEQ
jgi:protein O-mannosyl-transferase